MDLCASRDSLDEASSYLSIDVVRDDAVFRHCAGASAFAAARDAEEGVVRVRAEGGGAHDDELFFNRRRPADGGSDERRKVDAPRRGRVFSFRAPTRRRWSWVCSSLTSTVT